MYKHDHDSGKQEKFINNIVSKMSLEQKAGQCFTIHWGGSMITPYLLEAIEKLHIGGIRVTPFGQNSRRGKHYHQSLSYDYDYPAGYKKIKQNLFIPGSSVYVSPEQYAEKLNRLQDVACSRNPGIPLHVSIDQEGGCVNRLKATYGFPETLSHEELGSRNDPAFTLTHAEMIARTLAGHPL